jgi:hypothetical protein
VKTAREFAEEWHGRDLDYFAVATFARDAEWRRLVEEAQAETRRVNNEAQLRLAAVGTAAEEAQAERDRLKGELQAEIEEDDAATAEELKTFEWQKNEIDRLKRELAKARRLLNDAFLPSFSEWQSAKHAFLAATPAEQAQPTHRFVLQGDGNGCGALVNGVRCGTPLCQGPHTDEPSIIPAEKALGEWAEREHKVFEAGVVLGKAEVNAQVAAFAKRVDVLEIAAEADAKSWAETALTLMNRVTKLEARLDRITSPPSRPFVSEIKRHWDDPAVRDNFVDATLDDHEARLRGLGWRFKTPTETAGPGHAFDDNDYGSAETHCWAETLENGRCGESRWHPIHAVPPIPGGAKP